MLNNLTPTVVLSYDNYGAIGCAVSLNGKFVVWFHWKEFDEKFENLPQFEDDYRICYYTFEFYKILTKTKCIPQS
jgi:hypothetical protein